MQGQDVRRRLAGPQQFVEVCRVDSAVAALEIDRNAVGNHSGPSPTS